MAKNDREYHYHAVRVRHFSLPDRFEVQVGWAKSSDDGTPGFSVRPVFTTENRAEANGVAAFLRLADVAKAAYDKAPDTLNWVVRGMFAPVRD